MSFLCPITFCATSCASSSNPSGRIFLGSTGTSTSGTVTSTSSTGAFTYTCAVTDNGGLNTLATDTYSVTQTPNTGSSTTSTTLPDRVYSFTKITPGAATIIKDFNSETGLKQIEIQVNNEAQNVRVSVTKYDGRPADVSVSKTGKVYQYMQISVQNLADKLKWENLC